jgi:hypothetical protein
MIVRNKILDIISPKNYPEYIIQKSARIYEFLFLPYYSPTTFPW